MRGVWAGFQLLCQEPWFWAQNAKLYTTAQLPDFAQNPGANLGLGESQRR